MTRRHTWAGLEFLSCSAAASAPHSAGAVRHSHAPGFTRRPARRARRLASRHVVPLPITPRSVPLAEMAADRGQRTTLDRVVARLRCERCGKPPARVDAALGDPFGTRAWRVPLIPPGTRTRRTFAT